MKQNEIFPLYGRIAVDIATRIARGDLKENAKIYGRSVMASEYGVSPETIRRSLKQLADMGIVEIKQNSGVIVLSKEKANQFIRRFGDTKNIHTLQKELKTLLEEQEKLNTKIYETVNEIIHRNEKFARNNPYQLYEVTVPENSPLHGKSLSEVNFWHETGATVIAIARGESTTLSPGPYSAIMVNDRILFVGDISTVDIVESFLKGK